jgi:hypothetical protein
MPPISGLFQVVFHVIFKLGQGMPGMLCTQEWLVLFDAAQCALMIFDGIKHLPQRTISAILLPLMHSTKVLCAAKVPCRYQADAAM